MIPSSSSWTCPIRLQKIETIHPILGAMVEVLK